MKNNTTTDGTFTLLQEEPENIETKDYTKSPTWVKNKSQSDIDYKNKLNLPYKWALFEKFRAGEQWPNTLNEKTKDFPRPVFNLIEYIENHKVSAVMSENIAMVFSNQEGAIESDGIPAETVDVEAISDQFTRVAATAWENIKQRQLNEKLLHMASNKGIGILHYYWDDSVQGGRKLLYNGDMKGESLSPQNVGFGNPQSLDVQPQPWILIRSRDTLSNIRNIARLNGVPLEQIALIKGDKDTKDNPNVMAQIEIEEDSKANVITIYFKAEVNYLKERKVHVFLQKTCSGVNIYPAKDTGLEIYPIAIMNWNEREDCIYGMGDAEGNINNQRIINLLLALQVLSVQLTGFPKPIVKKGKINMASLNNSIGGVIEDIAETPGLDNIKYMQPGQVSAIAESLTETFMQQTKVLKGANETATGELNKAGQMNATAIALLQKASGVPIEGIKGRFYQAMEDVGRIYEAFFKVKYNTTRIVNVMDDDNNEVATLFNGSEAADIDFKLKIDIGASADYSETFTIQALDKFLDAGLIDFDTYLKYAPKNVIPFKAQLMKDRERMREQQQAMEQQDALNSMNPAERAIFDNLDPQMQEQAMASMMAERKNMMMQEAQDQQQNKPTAKLSTNQA